MSRSHSLYQLLIGPLELIFELVYGLTNLILNNAGLAIFALSLTMNFLLLPLYRRADAIQAEEREIEKRLAPWVTHSKKSFTGDERFMLLQTYYRQNNYKPFYALKGSLPLVLEIPFFIAAYHFLSHLSQLRGMPFGPIADLGAPDGLLTIAGVTVHVLPILMTLINVVSSAIYTRGFPLKDKLQLYGMALIFLVLLYGSPSGLVLYWLTNNVLSILQQWYVNKQIAQERVVRVSLRESGRTRKQQQHKNKSKKQAQNLFHSRPPSMQYNKRGPLPSAGTSY